MTKTRDWILALMLSAIGAAVALAGAADEQGAAGADGSTPAAAMSAHRWPADVGHTGGVRVRNRQPHRFHQ